jgi:hypothetical protein
MKTKLFILTITLIAAALFHACNVHEWPELPTEANFRLELKFSTDWDVLETPYTTRTAATLTNVDMRYIVRAYPASGAGKQTAIYEQIFDRGIDAGYDCSVDLALPIGEYRIMVWADFVNPGADDHLFYESSVFNNILLHTLDEHPANTDYRDAFRGIVTVSSETRVEVSTAQVIEVPMERPLCKYQVISTDLMEFIDKETKALTKAPDYIPGVTDTKVNIDDYLVRFYYTGYMPCAYNMFTDKPADSKTGVIYESKIKELNEKEASLGFDYLFINGTGSSTYIQIEICNREGTRLALSQPIEIPLKRNQHTLLIGKFMSSDAGGGVSISPEFSGDINLILP